MASLALEEGKATDTLIFIDKFGKVCKFIPIYIRTFPYHRIRK